MTTTDLAIPSTDSVEVQLAGRTGTVLIPLDMIEKYPALNPEIDLSELLEGAGVEELRLSDLTKLKVPSAELTRLMVPDEDGELTPVAQLNAIPVGMTSRRSWWVDDTPSGKAPDCKSSDLIHGVGTYGPGSEGNPSGLCADCPMSAIGSANKGTNASACKEQKLLFVLTDRELLPLMIVVPAGSLQNHKAFGLSLAKRGILGPPRPELGLNERGKAKRASQWLAVEVGIGLEQKTNPAGQSYNMLTFKQVRKLSPGEAEAISVYGLFIDKMIEAQADQLDDVAANIAAEAAGGGQREGMDDVDDAELIDMVDVPAGSTSR